MVFAFDYLSEDDWASARNTIMDFSLVAITLCIALGIAAFLSIVETLSEKAQERKKNQCAYILEAFREMGECDDQRLIQFLNELTEWDFYAMSQGHKVIHTEYVGVRIRRGYSARQELGEFEYRQHRLTSRGLGSKKKKAGATEKPSEANRDDALVQEMPADAKAEIYV